ncbi:hypothetical protein ACLKA7_015209 [Drosophila subpalustris]
MLIEAAPVAAPSTGCHRCDFLFLTSCLSKINDNADNNVDDDDDDDEDDNDAVDVAPETPGESSGAESRTLKLSKSFVGRCRGRACGCCCVWCLQTALTRTRMPHGGWKMKNGGGRG